jgi:predicted dehydrogenase
MHELLKDPRVEFNAVCDIDPEALTRAAKAVQNIKKNEPQQFENYQDLLDQADIDAVVIAPPDYMHHDIALAAYKAEKHVFLEKPVGINLDQMIDIVRAGKVASDNGKITEIGYVLRYAPFYTVMKQMLEDGTIGRPLFATALEQYHGAPFFRGWWKSRANVGGIMIQKICHDMDLHYWMFGKPSRIVAFESLMEFKPGNWDSDALTCPECTNHCAYYTRTKGTNSDTYECVYNDPHDIVDTSQVLVKFETGMTLSMGMNFVDSVQQSDRFWRIVGSNAEVTGRLGTGILRYDARQDKTGKETKMIRCVGGDAGGHAGGEFHQIQGFVDSIELGHESKAGLESAYWSSIMVMGAQISADTESIVKVEDLVEKYPFPE